MPAEFVTSKIQDSRFKIPTPWVLVPQSVGIKKAWRWGWQGKEGCENLFFACNSHGNSALRRYLTKILKLFSKNELDVKRRL